MDISKRVKRLGVSLIGRLIGDCRLFYSKFVTNLRFYKFDNLFICIERRNTLIS